MRLFNSPLRREYASLWGSAVFMMISAESHFIHLWTRYDYRIHAASIAVNIVSSLTASQEIAIKHQIQKLLILHVRNFAMKIELVACPIQKVRSKSCKEFYSMFCEARS
jgi:hypothetical protein